MRTNSDDGVEVLTAMETATPDWEASPEFTRKALDTFSRLPVTGPPGSGLPMRTAEFGSVLRFLTMVEWERVTRVSPAHRMLKEEMFTGPYTEVSPAVLQRGEALKGKFEDMRRSQE